MFPLNKAIPIFLYYVKNRAHYKISDSLEHVVNNNPYESHSIVKSIIYKGVSIHFLSIFALKWSRIEEWRYGG